MSYDTQLLEAGLCPDLVERFTEDGPVSGRCERPIVDNEYGACAYHADERREWERMSEGDKAQWELDQEGF